MSEGLRRAGFEVTAVDINPQPHHRGGAFLQADATELLRDRLFLRQFDLIHASPPCQGYSALRHLTKGKEYPKLIETVRFLLQRSGVPWSIEDVPGAPLRGNVTVLCGTMFGLQTPDGRAELRRHRLFETSWPIALRPACQHGRAGGESLSVTGTGMGAGNGGKEAEMSAKRALRVLTIAGNHPDAKSGGLTATGRSSARERFSTADARAAMGIDWMPMKYLSQAIPPAYAEWIGHEAIAYITHARRAVG